MQPLELAAHAVQLLAARAAQLGRQGAELAQGERQRARAPERLDACVFELRGRRGPLEQFAPLALEAGGVLHGHPRVGAGTRETPPRYHPACAVSAPLASRPFGGVPPGSGGELRRTVRAGALSLGPAPCRGRRPPTRLRRRRSRHSTAYASAAAPGGEAYERLGPLYDRWCAGVDHDIAFYLLACEGAAGPIIELGAGSGRIAVELARHGHRVIALDAAPAMLAQAERRARRHGVALETVLGDLRDPPALPRERSRDRAVPDVHAPHRATTSGAARWRPRRRCSRDGGQFIFDVFEPSAADIRATHDRWIARREGISEHPLWDAEERRLELDVRLPGRIVSMTLEWRNAAEWRALCEEAGLTVSPA